MPLLYAILIAVVEGLTEFLPISSTGHMILTAKLLRLPDSEFLGSFEIVIQLGAILAVLITYGRRLFSDRRVLYRVAAAFAPTAVIGFILYKAIKQYLLGNAAVVLASLLLGGIIIVIFEKYHREKPTAAADIGDITVRQAVIIGFCQALAVVPGVSRAGATVIGGLALGLKRRVIVEFSFLIAVPTMAAAAGLDLLKSGAAFNRQDALTLLVGFVVAFAVALLAIRWFLRFVQTRTFTAFGVYRIVLAIVMGLVLFRL